MKSGLSAYLLLVLFFWAWLAPVIPQCSTFSHAHEPITDPETVVDQMGRRMVVERPFQRIISLYGAHTENLFSLGLDEEIIGVSRNEAYPEEATRKPAFSYHDDPEKFLAARPDLVLTRPMIDQGYPQFIDRLERSGITVASFQPNTVEEMFRYWEALGVLTGREVRAQEMVHCFRQTVAEIRSRTGKIRGKKRVYFEAIHSKMKTFSPDAMPVFALRTAGGIPVASDAEPVRGTNIAAYGKERILAHAREIDVYLAQKGVMNQPTISQIKNEPGFEIIKAAQNDQIYIIDERIISRPTLRLLNGIFRIRKILYPERFSAFPEPAACSLAGNRAPGGSP